MSKIYEESYPCNTVVGYEHDKVIVKQDDGLLFFCKMPENIIELGETVKPMDLTSIRELSEKEQILIRQKYADSEV